MNTSAEARAVTGQAWLVLAAIVTAAAVFASGISAGRRSGRMNFMRLALPDCLRISCGATGWCERPTHRCYIPCWLCGSRSLAKASLPCGRWRRQSASWASGPSSLSVVAFIPMQLVCGRPASRPCPPSSFSTASSCAAARLASWLPPAPWFGLALPSVLLGGWWLAFNAMKDRRAALLLLLAIGVASGVAATTHDFTRGASLMVMPVTFYLAGY